MKAVKIFVKYMVVFVLSVLMITFCSCSGDDDDDNDTASPSSIMPLEIGNFWTWTFENIEETWTVSEETTLQGVDVYKVTVTSQQNEDYALYFRNEEDGLYAVGSDFEFFDPPRLYIKYPVDLGEDFIDGWSFNYTVVSLTETVTVPAGTFTECIKYEARYPGGDLVSIEYWKPGVGRIKQDFIAGGIVFELKNYSV